MERSVILMAAGGALSALGLFCNAGYYGYHDLSVAQHFWISVFQLGGVVVAIGVATSQIVEAINRKP